MSGPQALEAGASSGEAPASPSGRKPRILIVAAFFAPSRLIGARRPERMARELKARGWDVTILTLQPRFMTPVDDGMADPEGVRVVRTTMVRPGAAARSIVAGVGRLLGVTRPDAPGAEAPRRLPSSAPAGAQAERSKLLQGARDRAHALADWLSFPDAWSGWVPFAVRAAREARPDVVLATIPPFTPAVVADRIARATGARLVLDYRDPWADAPDRRAVPGTPRARFLSVLRRSEDERLARSALVLATTRKLVNVLSSRTPAPVVFVPNSFDAGAAGGARVPHSGRDIVYLGSLSYGRDLTPVMRAMAGLPADERSAARLVYGGPHGDLFRAEAQAAGIADRVADLGNLPREEAQRLLRSAALSVVIVADGYEYMLPGKLVEAVGVGCPVLVLGSTDCEAFDIARRHELGWCHTPRDADGIRESIRRCLRGERPQPRNLSDLSTASVMDGLDAELRRLVPAGDATGR